MATKKSLLEQPSLIDAYRAVMQILKRMYWEASTVECKDEVYGVTEEIGDVVDQLSQDSLQKNTDALLALQPRISALTTALQRIQTDTAKITKNLKTISDATAAITRAVALAGKI